MGPETNEGPRSPAGPTTGGVMGHYAAEAAGLEYHNAPRMSSQGEAPEETYRGLGGAYIPAHVLFAKGLSPRAKLLFGRIMGLDSGERGCYASNEFLAQALEIEPETVTRILYELIDRGFIVREFVRVGNHVERRLYPAGFPQPAARSRSQDNSQVPNPDPIPEQIPLDEEARMPDPGGNVQPPVTNPTTDCDGVDGRSGVDERSTPTRMVDPPPPGSTIRGEYREEIGVEESSIDERGDEGEWGRRGGSRGSRDVRLDPLAVQVLERLNVRCNRHFQPTRANLRYIRGRFREGWKPEDLILVIEHKAAQWSTDDRMQEYLRPQTLFGPEKFAGYIAAARDWDSKGRPDPKWRAGAPTNVVGPEDDLARFVRQQYGKTKEA